MFSSSSKIGQLSTLFLTAILTSLASSAEALTLNSSSGTWSNPVGGSGIRYEIAGEENRIRWGVASGQQSGLGFTGIDSTEIEPENVFQVGMLRHFNNPIFANTAAAAVDLTISLDFLELGTQQFNFTLDIDETPNVSETCPYFSTRACSDKISWTNALTPQTFTFGNQNYTLELLGFRENFDSPMVSDFISQEGGTSQAYLYAKVTAVGLPNEPIRGVPEPATLLGIGLVSLYFAASRRQTRS